MNNDEKKRKIKIDTFVASSRYIRLKQHRPMAVSSAVDAASAKTFSLMAISSTEGYVIRIGRYLKKRDFMHASAARKLH